MQHVLITGGVGFIGSRLAGALRCEYPDSRITVVDNLSRRGSELNVPGLQEQNISFIQGDVRQETDMARVQGPVSLVIDCSSDPSVLAGYNNSPSYSLGTTINGARHCLEICREHQAGLVYMSTSRIYPVEHLRSLRLTERDTRFELADDQPLAGASALGISEGFPLDGWRSFYGSAKLAAELLIAEYAQAYRVKTVINRCGVVAGPGQFGHCEQGVFAYWLMAHYFHRPLKYINYKGSGKQLRDMVHVDDLCDLVLKQIRGLDEQHGQTFNVGGGIDNTLSLRETTDLCRQLTGKETEVTVSSEERPADIPAYVTDISRVKAAYDWRPQRTSRRTLEDIAQWVRDNEGLLKDHLKK